MDPQEARIQLNLFIDNLPDEAFIPLRDKSANPSLLTTDIASAQEFAIRETGNICEGVLRVLTGVDSPSAFLAFIQKDPNIEEDNRPKLPELAYEIQTKVFDIVLPILKQAGYPIKEGRVPEPPPKPVESPLVKGALPSSAGGMSTTPGLADSATTFATQPPRAAPFGKGDGDTSTRPPLEEKNMRALVRIAAGTKYSEEELRNAFEDLPLGLRQSLSSVDTANAIQDIAKKYLLHVDQMAALASETGLVLLGFTHPADFIKNLAGRLRVPEERAKEIAREVSSHILVKVRESLRSLHAEVVQPPPVGVGPRLGAQTSFSVPKPSVAPPSYSSFAKGGAEGGGFKIPPASERGLPLAPTTPPRRLGTPPQAGGEGELPKANTPYSAGAKWNTEKNILAKQTGTAPSLAASVASFVKVEEGEEPLSRADVLRDIENPKGIVPVPRILAPTLPSSSLTAKSYQLKASPVGPTGWKPATSEGGKSQLPTRLNDAVGQVSNYQTNLNSQTPKNPPAPPIVPSTGLPKYPINKLESPLTRGALPSSAGGVSTTPGLADSATPYNNPPGQPPLVRGIKGDKAKPTDVATTPPPPASVSEPEDFLDQKLQSPMALPKEEKHYSSDPYREPLS